MVTVHGHGWWHRIAGRFSGSRNDLGARVSRSYSSVGRRDCFRSMSHGLLPRRIQPLRPAQLCW